MMDLRMQPGILGTEASLLSDLTLLAYILLIVPGALLGYYFARRKLYEPHHKWLMTAITLVNWVLILFVMLAAYANAASQITTEFEPPDLLLPTLHLITGGMAQILATYLVIRMWFGNRLPERFRIERIKAPMRATLALWLATAVLGAAIYLTWYASDSPLGNEVLEPALTAEADSPAATLEAEFEDETEGD
jgi:uncharacterized membrane protein YozB (DUF420 family)